MTLSILITVILLHGFGILTYLFIVHRSVEEQLGFIIVHLGVSLVLFLFWRLERRYRSVFAENKSLRHALAEMEGYKNSAEILSYTHFLSHVSYIMAATKRAGKKNHLLKIAISEEVENASSIEHVLLDSAVKTFRTSFFDLISQRNTKEIIVFLQDTSLEGCALAIDRLMANLYEKIKLTNPFSVSIYEVVDANIEKTLATGEFLHYDTG